MIRQPPRSTRTDTLFPYTPRFRSRNSTVNVLSLVGQAVESGDGDVRLPEDWRSNLLLGDPDDAVAAALRSAVLAAGWTWQPRLWPWPALWRDPWHPDRKSTRLNSSH